MSERVSERGSRDWKLGGERGEGGGHVHRRVTLKRGRGGLQHYEPRGRSGRQVLILARGRRRAGAQTSGKAIFWNRPPREDRSTI